MNCCLLCSVIRQLRMYHMKKLFLSSLTALLVVSFAVEEEEDSKSKKDNVGTVVGIDLGTTYSW